MHAWIDLISGRPFVIAGGEVVPEDSGPFPTKLKDRVAAREILRLARENADLRSENEDLRSALGREM